MIRKIIKIHEEKCNGCGICVSACHEGAIVMENGKAKLISDQYCDGLGDCLPGCPMDAIELIERDADAYSQEAVDARLASLSKLPSAGGCPGKMQQTLKVSGTVIEKSSADEKGIPLASELMQWPVQLMLINPEASFLHQADLLIAADCTAYAYANMHQEFMKDRMTIIGCPKLDDQQANLTKLTSIFTKNTIKSVLVIRMEVPCCSGLVGVTKEAIAASGKVIPYAEVTITTKGERR